MVTIIFAVLFSALVAFFATQNTATITLHFISFSRSGIPLYLPILASLLIGLLFSWILQLLNAIASSFVLRAKNKTIKESKDENLELTKKIHKLEIENTKLTLNDPEKTLIESKSL